MTLVSHGKEVPSKATGSPGLTVTEEVPVRPSPVAFWPSGAFQSRVGAGSGRQLVGDVNDEAGAGGLRGGSPSATLVTLKLPKRAHLDQMSVDVGLLLSGQVTCR